MSKSPAPVPGAEHLSTFPLHARILHLATLNRALPRRLHQRRLNHARYDKTGRITQVQKKEGTTTYTIGYQYNTAGQIMQITYPSGRVVQQNVDAIGRLSSITDTKNGVTTTRASGYSYNTAEQVQGFSYGSGVAATFGYDPLRQELTSLSYIKGTQTLFSLNYYYQNDSTNCPTGTTANDGLIECIKDNVDGGRSAAPA